ncbi:serine protease 27-like [Elgaria multicarinata webbii]|uniref:serine protease 27-like n=1 Tax=Elgaria multicarinata webbii TaxID=159646 RepID=UPI002FCD0D2B
MRPEAARQGAANSEAACGQLAEGQSGSQWPWQVSILRDSNPICGGSLIAEQWVLTAAHCFFGFMYPSQYDVMLGAYQINRPMNTVVKSKVKQIISHPDFSGRVSSSEDIALLKLVSPVKFTDYILPVCLPHSSIQFSMDADCWVTGWQASQEVVGLPPPLILKEVKVPLINQTDCNTFYNSHLVQGLTIDSIMPDMGCAGYPEGGNGTSKGDSGGPLVCKLKGGWTQAGILSWGVPCGRPNYPGVYTSVAFYDKWIKETMDNGKNIGLQNTPAVIFLLMSLAIALL